jgi:WD40 repeat protein
MPSNKIHPSESEITAFLLGQLGENASALMHEHIEKCTQCLFRIYNGPPNQSVDDRSRIKEQSQRTPIKLSDFQRHSPPSIQTWGWRTTRLITVLIFVFVMITAIYRFQTDNGELVIDNRDDELEVIIKQDAKIITSLDLRYKNRVTLPSGGYQLELGGKVGGSKLSIEKVTISRGDIILAKVLREKLTYPKKDVQSELTEYSPVMINEISTLKQPGNLYQLCFSSDAKRLAVRGDKIVVWNIETNQKLREFSDEKVGRLAMRGDGRAVAYSTEMTGQCVIKVMDVNSGKELNQLPPFPHGSCWGVHFTPNDDELLICIHSDIFRANLKSNAIEKIIEGPDFNEMRFAEFSPDKTKLLIPDTVISNFGRPENAFKILEFPSLKTIKQIHLKGIPQNGVRMAKWNAKGDSIIGTLYTGEVIGYSLNDGKRLYRRSNAIHSEWSNVTRFPDRNCFASAAHDGWIRVWDASTGEKLAQTWTEKAMLGIAVSEDGKKIATGSTTGEIKLWNFKYFDSTHDRLLPSQQWMGHTGLVSDIITHPDGKSIVSLDEHGLIVVRDTVKGDIQKRFVTAADPLTSPGISPDGKYVALGCNKNSLRWFELETGKELGSIPISNCRVRNVAFTEDSKQILATGQGVAGIWDLGMKKQILAFNCDGMNCHWVTFSPDQSLVLVAGERDGDSGRVGSGEMRLFESGTGKLIRTFSGSITRVSHVSFSSNGKYVVASDDGSTATIWDIATGKILHSFPHPHGTRVRRGIFTPDGQQLITTYTDNNPARKTDTVAVWNIETGKPIYASESSRYGAYSAALTRDGRNLIVGDSQNGNLRVHPLIKAQEELLSSVTDFREVHSVDLPELKAWISGLPAGYTPSEITRQSGSLKPLFNAIAVQRAETFPFEVKLGVPTVERFNDVKLHRGMSLRGSCVYTVNGEPFRHHLWVKDSTEWVGVDCEVNKLPMLIEQWKNRHLRPVAFVPPTDANPRNVPFGLVAGPDEGIPWELHIHQSDEQVVEIADTAKLNGWRVDLVAMYGEGKDRYFAVLTVANPNDLNWLFQMDLKENELVDHIVKQKQLGRHLKNLASYDDSREVRYATLWLESSPSR